MIRPSNNRVPVTIALAAFLLLIPGIFLATTTQSAAAQHQHVASDSLGHSMRMLWEDHVTWTRLYIVSSIADLPDTEATAGRLLQNQVDIGNAIAPYYGVDVAAQLTQLLQDHILGAATLIDAAKTGDQAAIATAGDAWYANGDEIATFLSNLNPDSWPLVPMQEQMKMHLDLTLSEATHRLQGDFAADIADYDQIRTHILQLADLLSEGIEAQFPLQFS